MVWQQWALVGYFTVSALATIAFIGEPRKPTTPGQAVFGVILIVALIYLIVTI